MLIIDQCDAAMFAAYVVLLFGACRPPHGGEGHCEALRRFLQASAGGMQGLELSRRTRLEFNGVFRMA